MVSRTSTFKDQKSIENVKEQLSNIKQVVSDLKTNCHSVFFYQVIPSKMMQV
jgi:hypothetical protein